MTPKAYASQTRRSRPEEAVRLLHLLRAQIHEMVAQLDVVYDAADPALPGIRDARSHPRDHQ